MSAFGKLLKSYIGWTILVVVLGFAANGLALYVPRLSATVIDQITGQATGNLFGGIGSVYILLYVGILTFIISVLQIYASTYFSERVGLDLRRKLINKISDQSYTYISNSTPGRLLTIMTSDIDAVKEVISQGLVTLLGAIVTLFGSIVLLLLINVKLALITLSVIPFLILSFVLIFGNLSKLFQEGQEILEKINAILNESIVGAALVRVLNSTSDELRKFGVVNTRSREIGTGIVKSISALIPAITLLANASTMLIIWFGGLQVINHTLTIGNFSAFISYSAMFIWPMFVLSFVGTQLSMGGVSLKRINEVLDAPIMEEKGEYDGAITGTIEFKNVSLVYKDAKDETGNNDRTVLKNISFKLEAGTKNAIVGPTAAGKTQLFYLMSGLVAPTEGEILIDGRPLAEYQNEALFSQIGLVFQDSIMFNTTFRDNIALSEKTPDDILQKAIQTAELGDLVASLPQGLETLVSERGTSLSGGQKQRLMLARALAVNPKILLLDDFTARVDQATEASILSNVTKNFPQVTLVSITQKVEPIKSYDQIVVLMEGELVSAGTHDVLIKDSFEYKQIYESQQSTEA